MRHGARLLRHRARAATPAARRCRPPPRRGYFTIPSVRFSPSHTASRDFVWAKEAGDHIACYDLLYTTTATDVTIFCAGAGKRMEVECCEEGVLAWVLPPGRPGENVAPQAPLGILAASEAEAARIQEVLRAEGHAGSNPVEVLRATESLEDEGEIAWEAYTAAVT